MLGSQTLSRPTSGRNYSDRVRDQRVHHRAMAAQKWLNAPIARLVLSKSKRSQIKALVSDLATRVAPEKFPAYVPPVGSSVYLLKNNRYLREVHGVVAGSTGTVVMHSQLHPDDDGVLVDWGDGHHVRSRLDELGL